MADTKKVEAIMAVRLQPGKVQGATEVWGGSASAQTLGAGNAFPYTDFSVVGNIEINHDDAIDGQAYKDVPNLVQLMVEGDIGGYVRYEGMDRLHYWGFGFEDPGNSPQTACSFTVSGISVDPAVDDVYSNNGSEFTIIALNLSAGAGTILTKRTSGSNPPESSGTLTRVSGSGDSTISFSATSSIYYAHLFELDSHERSNEPYRASNPNEQTAGDYNSADRKNRMATIGIKRGPNDHRFRDAMCKRMAFSGSAGEAIKFSYGVVAYKEERGDYSSSSWTFPSNVAGSARRALVRQLTVSLKPVGGAWVDLAISDFDVTVDMPLQIIQDTESDKYLTEPVMEGFYSVDCNLTLARHSVDTYLGYRDELKQCAVKIWAALGSANNEFRIYMPNLVVSDSEVTDDDVPQNTIKLASGPKDTGFDPFSLFERHGFTIVQNGPIYLITTNANSTNEMRRE